MAGKRRKRSPKQVAKAIAIEKRRARAIKLKLEGHGYRAVAAKLGVSVETAYSDVQAVLDETRRGARNDAEQERRLQLERLDVLVQKLTPLLDDEDKAARAAEVLKGVEERRAKLLGLDSPNKFEHSGPDGAAIPVDGIGTLIDRIASRIAGEAPEGDSGKDPGGSESASG